jgi:hypothetical protein
VNEALDCREIKPLGLGVDNEIKKDFRDMIAIDEL